MSKLKKGTTKITNTNTRLEAEYIELTRKMRARTGAIKLVKIE